MTALPVPTTAGRPYSRQTIAVWLMTPPTSDTVAAIRENTGDHAGDVAGQTSTSPSSTRSSSCDGADDARRALDDAGRPGLAAQRVAVAVRPLSSQPWTMSVVIPHSITVNGSLTSVGGMPSAGGASHALSAS